MRRDGRGHGDHDDDPRPIAATVFATLAPLALAALLAWALAGRPGFGLW